MSETTLIVIVAVAALLLAVFATACAVGSSLRSQRTLEDMATAMQLALLAARVVLDHETVEKLAAGVTWAPRDDLDELLFTLRREGEQLLARRGEERRAPG